MQSHIADYRVYLEGFDIHDSQKDDLIHILFRWAESFIDRAFGEDSVQVAQIYNQLAASKNAGQGSDKSVKFKRRPLTHEHHRITNDNPDKQELR